MRQPQAAAAARLRERSGPGEFTPSRTCKGAKAEEEAAFDRLHSVEGRAPHLPVCLAMSAGVLAGVASESYTSEIASSALGLAFAGGCLGEVQAGGEVEAITGVV